MKNEIEENIKSKNMIDKMHNNLQKTKVRAWLLLPPTLLIIINDFIMLIINKNIIYIPVYLFLCAYLMISALLILYSDTRSRV